LICAWMPALPHASSRYPFNRLIIFVMSVSPCFLRASVPVTLRATVIGSHSHKRDLPCKPGMSAKKYPGGPVMRLTGN
jgi:hypothetical protein